MQRIDAWGEITTVYVPGAMHRLDCAKYHDRYPIARIDCPPGAFKAVSKVCYVDPDFDLPAELGEGVSITELGGTDRGEGVLRIESQDGVTLVFNDALFNLPQQPGLGGMLLRWIGTSGGPKVTPLARLLVVKDKAALRSSLESLASDDSLIRLISRPRGPDRTGRGEGASRRRRSALARIPG